jgi:hypothetical protein
MGTRRNPPSILFPEAKEKTALVLSGKTPLSTNLARRRRLPSSLEPLFKAAGQNQRRLSQQGKTSIAVPTVTGIGSRRQQQYVLEQIGIRTINLPSFLSRRISAMALKQFAGMPEDTLFRKRGSAWEVVQDEEIIDLLDRDMVLSLGTITMLS